MAVNKSVQNAIKYRWIRSALNVLLILLLTIVLIIPGVLRLIYRADSQVALGNAKSVRVAFQVIGTEAYGSNGSFGDTSHKGGVADGLYDEIINSVKHPEISGYYRPMRPVIRSFGLFIKKGNILSGIRQTILHHIRCIMKRP